MASHNKRKVVQAFIALITNPVNSTVPIAIEVSGGFVPHQFYKIRSVQVLKNNGIDGRKRVFGVTTLDVVRAQAFVSELKVIRSRAEPI